MDDSVEAAHVWPSEMCDTQGAVDADVRAGSEWYEVTLIPDRYDGELDTWGTMDHWASPSLARILRSLSESARWRIIGEIVQAVREAFQRASREA